MSIAQVVREALSLGALQQVLPLPQDLGAVSVEVEEYVDHEGEDALKVWVVLRDDVDEEKLPYDDLLGSTDIQSGVGLGFWGGLGNSRRSSCVAATN